MKIGMNIIPEIERIISLGHVFTDVPMGDHTSFKTGGRADCLVVPRNEDELIALLTMLSGLEVQYMVIGSGTNLLVRDEGYHGVIIKLGKNLGRINVHERRIYAQAGAALPEVAVIARDAGLSGLEFSTGIPGSVGGGIYMNAGAFGGEISERIVSARVFLDNKIVTLDHTAMGFGYRHCAIKEYDGVILDAIFELAEGDPLQIGQTMQDISQKRRAKQPLDVPSAGSFFKRPEGHFAGKLIQEAGLGGLSVGGAEVSPMHTGFIVNRGGATASEIIDLMEIVRNTVYECSGVMLEPEVRIIGEVSSDM